MGEQVILKFVIEGDNPPIPVDVEALFADYQATVTLENGVYRMELVPGEDEDYSGVIWQISCDLREYYPGAYLIQ